MEKSNLKNRKTLRLLLKMNVTSKKYDMISFQYYMLENIK